jgi:hypothetical protein
MEDRNMKTAEVRRQEKLSELGQDRPFVAGSLNRVEHKDKQGRTTVYHLLTSKEAGKTKSVYVPKDMVKEVKAWIVQHRRLKKLMAEVSELSVAIIRNHVPEKRAAAAKRRPKKNSK